MGEAVKGIVITVVYLIPVALVGWILSLVTRAVKALESIAESLRQQRH